ncbi:daunorubicin/doxorubicin resistance ATP-binding protein DrrA [bacterium BMS3Bbin09]|nr:daunorubicin/doxorubicin resistance ATP-binding protein DrrA [bacterium BMS3Bbin09]HDH34480.1 heme ABC exporter ATP-binding protein CcmA [Nitrospirota bacterium]
MNLIEIRGLKKQYHAKTALNGIDIDIGERDSITVFGPNGAGKTTLLKIISGIMSPTEGNAFYNNKKYSESEMKKEVFYLGHKTSLYNALTVGENMDFICRLFSINHRGESVKNILKEHGLWERRRDPVNELSQGMKRRLALAKGFMTDPKVFILDEPFTGLDLRWRSSILSKIKDIRSQGKTVILSTHLVEEGFELATRVAFLHKGRFLFIKKKEEVKIEEIYGLFDSMGETGK